MPYKLPYLRYKLVSQKYTTHGNTLWRDAKGKWLQVSATGKGNRLCTSGVLHFYDHPVLAVLFNPVHAGISRPRLLKIRTSRPVAHDELKGGCKYACAVDELPVPALSRTQIVEFGIRVALRVHNEPSFRKWAHGWLTDTDRSTDRSVAAATAADAAVYAAYAARSARSAAWAANAARSAACAATAAYYAANAANSTRIFKSVLKTMKLYKLTGTRGA